MQREFGGYLPLELPHGQELYTGAGVLRLNCGRNAIVAALRDAGAKKVYLPYYNCNTVYDAVTRAGFAVERYPLDARVTRLYTWRFGGLFLGIALLAKHFHAVCAAVGTQCVLIILAQ